MNTTVIRAGKLIGMPSNFVLENMEVHIEGSNIRDVCPQGMHEMPRNATVLDWGRYAVMPGLIDCHDHLCSDLGEDEIQFLREPEALAAFRAARNAKAMIHAGITTVRTMGEKNALDVSLEKAIEAGWLIGPRLVKGCQSIARTGGNAWFIGIEADGVDGVRRAVRKQVKAGADVIKIMLTGGGATEYGDPLWAEYSDEEIIAAIEEAHRCHKKIAAHALGGPAARTAIEHGVDSIEHGVYLTEEDLKLMAQNGVFLVVNVGTYATMVGHSRTPDAPAYFKRKCALIEKQYPRTIELAKKYGVKVAFGGDTYHADPKTELEGLVKAGFTHEEALRAGTLWAAELLGMDDRIGSVEPGKLADLIAVEGDPMRDVSVVAKVAAVMKGGKLLFVKDK